MSNKSLGLSGLAYLWSKIKSIFATKAEIDEYFDDVYEVIEENEEVVASALNDLNSRLDNMVVEETDPTVPDWAKESYPPSYSYSDVGALSQYAYVDGVGFNGGSNINHYNTCSTSASTTAKTVGKANFQLSTGAEITIKFTYTNTASNPTLNVNGTGARSIYYNGTNIPAGALAANRVYRFVYDGSYWQLVGSLGTTAEELINQGFLTDDDVTDEVSQEEKLITANAVYEYITEDEKVIASALNDLNSNKQNKLVSGTNIKTINNQSLLGEGNITISGGGSSGDVNVIETVKVNGTALTPDANKAVDVTVPTALSTLSDDSTHRLVTDTEKSTWNSKQDALTFDGTYNASTNKAATVSTVTNAINALDGGTIGTGGAGKTITSLSQTNGNVSATFSDISITKSQVSDFPTTMTPASHTHGNISNTGTLTDTAAAAAGNDYVVIRDASDAKIQTSTIKGTDVADAVSKKHEHSTLTLSTSAQAYDGTHTLALPASDPYTSARTPSAHNQASETINAMTGYSKGNSGAAVAATDTLNTAISKLENQIDAKTSNIGTITGITMNGASKGTSGVVDLGTVITAHQDISDKANKSEMSVVAGTGADADKTTITLKTGTSATVLTAHQDISGKADSATTLAGYGITDAYTEVEANSHFWSLDIISSTSITATSSAPVDLNDYTTPGTYVSGSTTTYQYVSNLPSDFSTVSAVANPTFRLYVFKNYSSGNTIKQRIENTRATCCNVWERIKYSTTWNNWVLVQADLTYKPNIYTGSSAPSSSTGSNGDIYIQTS